MQRGFGDTSLGDLLTRIETLVREPVATTGGLEQMLVRVYREFFLADFDAFDPRETAAGAAPLMQRMFELRLDLRRQIGGWAANGWMTRPVQKALRDVFRVTRYAGEMLGEAAIGHDRLAVGEVPRRAFTGASANTLVNPAFATGRDLPFQSGDVILVRGQAHNSAAIARIGDIDSQFSHIGIVYVDVDGTPWMVEALIEDGSIASPLETALDHGIGRAVLLRHRDAGLAAMAAAMIHDHVTNTKRPRILYDFGMAIDGYEWLYCSKLIRLAFLKASGGREVLPAYTTLLDMQNRDFLNRVGVKASETFAPADLEIDPRFEIVAEWADYRATAGLRAQDLIMTMLFDAMETHGYRFRPDWSIELISILGRISARMFEAVKLLLADVFPRIPINMKRKTIAVIAMLHHTAQPLLEQLIARDQAEIARTGRPLHPRQVLAILDGQRKASGGRLGYLEAPKTAT